MAGDSERLPSVGSAIHFIGIGGAGMSSLALALSKTGYQVRGTDLAPGSAVELLRQDNIRVEVGHHPAMVDGASLVVRSSAVPDADPEVARARALGILVLKHAEVLGRLSATRRTLAVAGTHGKTTTT